MYKAAKQLGSEDAKHDLGARQSSSLLGREIERGVESNKADLDVKTQRNEDVKRHSLLRLMKFDLFRKIVDILSLVKRNILISPLEGEKKFLSELCELRNFREGYKKYKTLDRATECVMTDVGDKKGKIEMNKNNLQPKQPNNPVASPETNHSPLTIHHSPKRIAFTLAEVLITLGIIGVVAALTMPTVINNVQGKQLQIALKKGYSIISQAFELMQADIGGNILPEDYIVSRSFAKEYKEYFVKALYARHSGLVSKDFDVEEINNAMAKYKNYTQQRPLILNFFDDGQFVLSDGTLILINDSGPMLISIDVNGMNKGPNVYGRDLFSFEITNAGKLLPVGAKGTIDWPCSKSSTSYYNGGGCAYYAITDPNYFKKRYYK